MSLGSSASNGIPFESQKIPKARWLIAMILQARIVRRFWSVGRSRSFKLRKLPAAKVLWGIALPLSDLQVELGAVEQVEANLANMIRQNGCVLKITA